MNTLQKSLISLSVGSLLSVSAQAAVNYAGQPYVGVKVGQYSPDLDDVDDATSYGIYGGYKMTNNFGIEAEFLGTGDENSYEDVISKEEYSAKTYGLYGTYDYVFPTTNLYAKGRLGIAKNEVEVKDTFKLTGATEEFKLSETGVAGGLGLGYNITPMASVEAMYNIYPTIDADDNDDIDVSGITLGAHIKF